MADTTALKNRIRAAVKSNDNQEITGPILQQALLDLIDELNGATETEADARQNGDSTLQQAINSEAQTRQNGDSTLQQAINSEAQTRQSADTQLNNLITGIKNNTDNAIRDVYKKSNYNDGDNIIDFNSINLIINSSRYIYALVDGNENLILGILRSNCHIVYGNGIPDEVKDYIDNQINEAISIANKYSSDSVNNLSDIIFKTFGIKDTNGEFLTMSTLLSVVDSKKYSEVKLDGNGNIIEARYKGTGIKEFFLPVKIQGTELSVISSDKYIFALLDGNDNFIIGINRKNANIEYGNGIPNEVQKAIESHTPNMEDYATEEYVDNKVEANGISNIEKQSIEDYNLPVPSYYKDYLAKRIAKINDTILNNEGYNDSFIFITDCHTQSNHMQSPKLIKYILANTTLNKVFYGGDIPIAYGTKDDVYNAALVFLKSFYKAVQPYGHLYCAVGNHDFTIRTSATDQTGYTFPRQFGRNVYMGKHRIGDGIVTNEDDSGAAYYYIDNEDEKVRYVVINTTDISNAGNNAWGTSTSLSKVQMNWIYNIAIKKCPKDYKIVIIGHIPPMRANISNGIQIGHWSNFITAMKNKTSVTIGDVSYDFSDIADIVFTIWGHEHQDEQTFANGIPWIVSACDASYNDYRHAMFGNEEDYPYKTRGTIYEQTFDIVNLDFNNNVANIIRIGGGYDRKIHLNIQEVKVGDTITLATDIESPIWEAVDAIGNTQDNHTWKWTKKSTITSISKDKVSALSIGYSVICAYNSTSKEMELWGIQVK